MEIPHLTTLLITNLLSPLPLQVKSCMQPSGFDSGLVSGRLEGSGVLGFGGLGFRNPE